jgi:hypothetical protein
MSYVLPLLNVPSPEGGYPLALSYHAGIAMDQEASWVGLGWTLNPGAINRSVKGVPDDWGKSRISELLYDRGETLDYYNFGIGGTLPNGITIGMSRSWGAHQAWGGTVGYAGMSVTADTDGYVGVGMSAGGFSLNMNSKGNGTASFAGLKYSEGQSGKSIGVAYGNLSAEYNITSGSVTKFSAIGVSLDTKTNSLGIGSISGGITSLQTSASSGDYYNNVSTNGFNFDCGFFWVTYQHTNYTYSLFKLNNNYISGTLNLYDTKKQNNFIQDGKYYMDLKKYSFNGEALDEPMNPYFAESSIILPNYDNYSINAQGIGGSFSPKIFDETLLYYGSKSGNYNYLTTPPSIDDNFYKLNAKIFFYFDNVNSSFLRTQRGTFKSLDSAINLFDGNGNASENAYMPPGNEGNLINNIITDDDNTFSSNYDNNGNLKKVGERKRDGNFIEAFTNSEIASGQTNGYFLEVPQYDRNSYNTIAPNGIGAYRVTALDGKVYHYSLPVYSMEEVQKNFKNPNDENEKFLETVKKNPYATHWLLTAITGPDYVDTNNNNITDEDDYGYWVQFDYGKWSDGYGWRSPKTGAKADMRWSIIRGYFYFWGRKEIYYLDKIKTRTHTALFVKSLRQDDRSTEIQKRVGGYNSGIMPREITENFSDRQNGGVEDGSYYGEHFTDAQYNGWRNNLHDLNPYKNKSYKYVDLPVNYSLKLDRILLLKNSNTQGIDKNLQPGSNRLVGYTYFDFGFTGNQLWYRNDPFSVKKSNINTDQNVLESNDITKLNQINGYDLSSKATKVINFNYDYSLGNSLPNASSGRLALRSIEFNGRNNTKVLPPYRFNYSKSSTLYNFNNADNWGYVKDNPDAWSLNEIITPTGGKIKVEYEPDSFIDEAAIKRSLGGFDSFDFSNNNRYPLYSQFSVNGNYLTIRFGTAHASGLFYQNLNNFFEIDDDVFFQFDFFKREYPNQDWTNYAPEYNSYAVDQIDNVNKIIVLRINSNTNLGIHNRAFYGPIYNPALGIMPYIVIPVGGPDEVIGQMQIIARGNQILQTYGLNGKNGGGIRVKKIITTNQENANSVMTEYDYHNPKNNRISGVTPYEPFDGDPNQRIFGAEEIPSPNVMYEYVTTTVKNSVDILNKTIYKFKTLGGLKEYQSSNWQLSSNLGDSFKIKFNDSNRRLAVSGDPGRKVTYDKLTLYDKLSSIGNLLSVQSYNDKNHLLKNVVNKYKEFTDNEIDNGISQESFKNILRYNYNERMLDVNGNPYFRPRPMYIFSSISKVTFPSKLESSTTTQGGYSNTVFYDKYDFLTGQVLETRSVSSDGKSFKTKVVPAYLKYPGTYSRFVDKPGMNSKVDDERNKNMLSQTAAEYSYIYDPTDVVKPWKETGVGITTWNNEWTYQDIEGNTTSPVESNEKVWRKHKSYTWNGVKDTQGIFTNYNNTNDDGFNWAVGVGTPTIQPAQWKQTSEVTLYDHYSMLLEMKDINNNRAATKMGDNDTKIMASGNAGYNELFYTGGENLKNTIWLEPEVKMSGASRTTALAHTGIYAISTTSSSQLGVLMRNGQHKAGRYKMNVWVHKTNAANARINYNGSSYAFNGESYDAGDWTLKTHYIDNVPTTDFNVFVNSADGTNVYYDDLMLRPVASSMTGYVYNEWDELSYILSNNGLATHFEYDAAGRLVRTSVEVLDDLANGLTGGFKLKAENKQKYKNL